MMRPHHVPSGLSIAVCSLLLVTLWSCSGDATTSSAPAVRSGMAPPVQPQDVDYPILPTGDFCGGSSVGTILEIETDLEAGLAYSSSILVPSSGGPFNIYYANLGPGPITFVTTGAFSVKGEQIPRGASTEIPMTPKGSSAVFLDRGWAGTFPEGVAYLGCANLDGVTFKSPKHFHGTAHLDMSFLRDGVLHTVRVNVHTANVETANVLP